MNGAEKALSELAAVRSEIAVAADAILFAAETGLSLLAENDDGGQSASTYSALFVAIVTACAFQDITGQRLSKIEALVTAAEFPEADDAPSFLEGPALPAAGLSQLAADAIFDDPPPGAATAT